MSVVEYLQYAFADVVTLMLLLVLIVPLGDAAVIIGYVAAPGAVVVFTVNVPVFAVPRLPALSWHEK